MKIYILVLVTYDHFRFQQNIFAHTDWSAVEQFALSEDAFIPVLNYSEYDHEIIDKLSLKETNHWWIQEFEI